VVRFGWFDLRFGFFFKTTLQLLDVVKYGGGKHFYSLLRDVVKQLNMKNPKINKICST
jgi:hypothetical protein